MIVFKSRHQPFVLITALLFLIMLVIILLFCLFKLSISDKTFNSDENNQTRIYDIISKEEWGGTFPSADIENMALPVIEVIIAHTSTEECHTLENCALKCRFIQRFHKESLNYTDIGYNFLIGGDGSIYIGRGWDKVGYHTEGYNHKSIGIALIGYFQKTDPPSKQIKAIQKLIQLSVENKKLTFNYKVYTQNQLINTISPGIRLTNIVKTLPNWSPKFHQS